MGMIEFEDTLDEIQPLVATCWFGVETPDDKTMLQLAEHGYIITYHLDPTTIGGKEYDVCKVIDECHKRKIRALVDVWTHLDDEGVDVRTMDFYASLEHSSIRVVE